MADPKDLRAAYSAAGVNVAAGDALVERIKPLAAATTRPGVTDALGGFAALFDPTAAGHADSLLVAATDGVGTKLRLAIDLGTHDTVGIDLVAMCVNDLLAQGAEPLFFLDYFATGKLDVETAGSVVEGIARGCRDAGCALIGGETAEMPGLYQNDDYDLAGFVVGAVPRDRVLPRKSDMEAGDTLIGIASSGAHSNGYSLIRSLAETKGWDLASPFGDTTLGEALMTPTIIYSASVRALLTALPDDVRGFAHITGGGITGNVPRMLPPHLAAHIRRQDIPAHPVMAFLASQSGLSAPEMEATFNCGVGMVACVSASATDAAIDAITSTGQSAVPIGSLETRDEASPACTIA
ncbi:MAG: phosphoribosylformylglycinamidine cyclo-ligase [Pseudomonadota bacterium]